MFGSRQERARDVPDENSHIAVVTSDVGRAYDVVDSVCDLSAQDAGFAGIELQVVFRHVKNKLRARCIELGGDAVINCHFSQRAAHSGGLVATQVIEIWAYGTVVRFRD